MPSYQHSSIHSCPVFGLVSRFAQPLSCSSFTRNKDIKLQLCIILKSSLKGYLSRYYLLLFGNKHAVASCTVYPSAKAFLAFKIWYEPKLIKMAGSLVLAKLGQGQDQYQKIVPCYISLSRSTVKRHLNMYCFVIFFKTTPLNHRFF